MANPVNQFAADKKAKYNIYLETAVNALQNAALACFHPGNYETLLELIKDVQGMKDE